MPKKELELLKSEVETFFIKNILIINTKIAHKKFIIV